MELTITFEKIQNLDRCLSLFKNRFHFFNEHQILEQLTVREITIISNNHILNTIETIIKTVRFMHLCIQKSAS